MDWRCLLNCIRWCGAAKFKVKVLGTTTPPVFSKTECCLFRRLNPIFYSALIKTKQALVHLADEPDPAPR